jgi:hypothetical protein
LKVNKIFIEEIRTKIKNKKKKRLKLKNKKQRGQPCTFLSRRKKK